MLAFITLFYTPPIGITCRRLILLVYASSQILLAILWWCHLYFADGQNKFLDSPFVVDMADLPFHWDQWRSVFRSWRHSDGGYRSLRQLQVQDSSKILAVEE